ncbi:hypothetical protein D3C73_1490040 [compost metagenome]
MLLAGSGGCLLRNFAVPVHGFLDGFPFFVRACETEARRDADRSELAVGGGGAEVERVRVAGFIFRGHGEIRLLRHSPLAVAFERILNNFIELPG